VFNWLRTLTSAGRRLAASLNALADTLDDVTAAARKATGMKAPAALPAPREMKAVAANKKE
jgi:hypothetical protein